jgi:hypothetical protein
MLQEKGLKLLDMASPSYLPGHLVKVHYFWKPGDFGGEPRLEEDRGLATDVLKIDSLALTPRVPADIVLENITDQFAISAELGLPQLGLTASGNLQHSVAITWSISAIETVAFGPHDLQSYFSKVLPNLRALANSNKKTYGWVRDIRRYICGADSLCRWLDGQGVAVVEANQSHIERYVLQHARLPDIHYVQGRLCKGASSVPFIASVLRQRGILSGSVPVSKTDAWLARFDNHLMRVHGISPESRDHYLRYVRRLIQSLQMSDPEKQLINLASMPEAKTPSDSMRGKRNQR